MLNDKIDALTEKLAQIKNRGGWPLVIGSLILAVAIIVLLWVFDLWVIAILWNYLAPTIGVGTIGVWDALIMKVVIWLLSPNSLNKKD